MRQFIWALKSRQENLGDFLKGIKLIVIINVYIIKYNYHTNYTDHKFFISFTAFERVRIFEAF